MCCHTHASLLIGDEVGIDSHTQIDTACENVKKMKYHKIDGFSFALTDKKPKDQTCPCTEHETQQTVVLCPAVIHLTPVHNDVGCEGKKKQQSISQKLTPTIPNRYK